MAYLPQCYPTLPLDSIVVSKAGPSVALLKFEPDKHDAFWPLRASEQPVRLNDLGPALRVIHATPLTLTGCQAPQLSMPGWLLIGYSSRGVLPKPSRLDSAYQAYYISAKACAAHWKLKTFAVAYF